MESNRIPGKAVIHQDEVKNMDFTQKIQKCIIKIIDMVKYICDFETGKIVMKADIVEKGFGIIFREGDIVEIANEEQALEDMQSEEGMSEFSLTDLTNGLDIGITRKMGKYFGYPECCVDDFIKRVTELDFEKTLVQHAVIDNHGFVPCNECAEKVLVDANNTLNDLSVLITGRICKTPYPDGGTDEDLDEYLSK